jgi:hypothetical protein
VSNPPPQRDFLFYSAGHDTRELLELPHLKAQEPTAVHGASAAADLDADGDLDLVIAVGYPPQLRILRNDGGSEGRYLVIELEGSGNNTLALGARVRVERLDGSHLETLLVGHAGGSLAGSPSRAHFGLCRDEAVAGVEIHWPSGAVQQLDGPIETNQVLHISETSN